MTTKDVAFADRDAAQRAEAALFEAYEQLVIARSALVGSGVPLRSLKRLETLLGMSAQLGGDLSSACRELWPSLPLRGRSVNPEPASA